MNFLRSLHERAARQPRRILFPEASDPRTREAVRALKARGVVEPVLVGSAVDAMEGIELIETRPGALADEVAGEIHRIRSPKGMTEEVAAQHAPRPCTWRTRWSGGDGLMAVWRARCIPRPRWCVRRSG